MTQNGHEAQEPEEALDNLVYLRMPRWAWSFLHEWLEWRVNNRGYDYNIRQEIKRALDSIEEA